MPIVYNELTPSDPAPVQPEDLWRMRPDDAFDNMWDAELHDAKPTEEEQTYWAARDQLNDAALFAGMTSHDRMLGANVFDGMY